MKWAAELFSFIARCYPFAAIWFISLVWITFVVAVSVGR